jgi:integrase
MKKRIRIVHLSDKAEEIISRLVERHPHGQLFRNSNGKPWTTEAVNCAFVALQIRMGKEVMKEKGVTITVEMIKALKPKLAQGFKSGGKKTDKELTEEARRKLANRMASSLAPKYCLTVFRHSYCHRLLRAGVDALTVATLMGHSGVSMVVKTYSHLTQAQDYLKDALRKAAG